MVCRRGVIGDENDDDGCMWGGLLMTRGLQKGKKRGKGRNFQNGLFFKRLSLLLWKREEEREKIVCVCEYVRMGVGRDGCGGEE